MDSHLTLTKETYKQQCSKAIMMLKSPHRSSMADSRCGLGSKTVVIVSPGHGKP